LIRCPNPAGSDRLLPIQLRVARKQVVGFRGASKSERVVQIVLPRPSVQQSFGLEPFEVWQVAQGGETKDLQEFPRRHIGEGGAGLRRADGAVDQAGFVTPGSACWIWVGAVAEGHEENQLRRISVPA
jgi:hypothetical protein